MNWANAIIQVVCVGIAGFAGYVAGRVQQMSIMLRRQDEFLSKLREPTLPPEPGLFDVPAEGGGVKPPPGAGDK